MKKPGQVPITLPRLLHAGILHLKQLVVFWVKWHFDNEQAKLLTVLKWKWMKQSGQVPFPTPFNQFWTHSIYLWSKVRFYITELVRIQHKLNVLKIPYLTIDKICTEYECTLIFFCTSISVWQYIRMFCWMCI